MGDLEIIAKITKIAKSFRRCDEDLKLYQLWRKYYSSNKAIEYMYSLPEEEREEYRVEVNEIRLKLYQDSPKNESLEEAWLNRALELT